MAASKIPPEFAKYRFSVGKKDTPEEKVIYCPNSQPQVDFLTAPELNVFLYGDRGGGKSVTVRGWCHGEAMAHPGLTYVIVRKGYPELTLNHLKFLKHEMTLLGGSYNSSEHICYYPNGSSGVYRQCSAESDIAKVVGAEAAIMVFDEAPELEWEWIRLMGASVRVNVDAPYLPRVRYLGNPIGPSIDQLWSYFIDKDVDPLADTLYNPNDWRAIKISMHDNKNLNVEEYLKQFQGIPEHIKRAWVHGLKVYEGAYFVIDPNRHNVSQRPSLTGYVDAQGYIHPAPHVYRAIDWGWHDQMVCLWIAVYPNGRAIVFKELVRTHTTAKDVKKLIKDMSEGMTIRETFCDPSMFPPDGSDIKLPGNIIEENPNGIPLTKSRNDRIAAGFSISEWLNTPLDDGFPALQFWTPGCPVLVKTLPSMRMDPKKPEKIADSSKDHATITLSYFTTAYSLNPRIHKPGPDPTRLSSIIRNTKRPEPSRLGRLGVRR